MLRNIQPQIDKSVEVLQLASEMSKAYYKKPLIIAYSGGKDSDVLLRIAMDCLPPTDFEVVNSHTSVDAPETVYHIREVFAECEEKGIKATVHIPRDKDGKQITMWNLIPKKKMPPTRIVRYCCQELKETSTPNRMTCVGVRKDESVKHFCQCNAFKYVYRMNRKNGTEDAQKAVWYLNKYLELEKHTEEGTLEIKTWGEKIQEGRNG